MSQASEVELLMLQLINEERTSRGLDPLTINNDLNTSSEDHSQWMLDTDIFSHTGVGGSSSNDRIDASDYALDGSWRTAENIGWQSERGAEGITDDVADIHESLMNSPGHRANILDPDLEDIGIGIETGDFQGFEGVMVTQNFGRTDAVSETPQQDSAPIVTSETDDPAEVPIDADDTADDGPSVTTGTTSSGGTVAATSGPDGVNVEVDGTATNGDEAVTETASVGSLEAAAPDENGASPTFDVTALFDSFDFADIPAIDDGADHVSVVAAFEGTIVTSDGTFTTDDAAEFNAMFTDMFTMQPMSCTETIDFG